jgi:dienelactone hydrolase
MGGAIVLNMARAGEDLAAVVSFHGILETGGPPVQAGVIKGRVLALNGDNDAFVPKEQIDAFKKEMADAKVDAATVVYPGVKHGFTNPNAAKYGMPELAYNAEAAKSSWDAMLKLFKTSFGA